ncbi:MAG: hypothetical protein WC809_14190 [Sinimarinibacterium sp.]|jgi:hypothetical protein
MKDDEAQLAALIHRGKKIEAIERLRQRTGIGLAEAKAEIERIEMRATAIWAPSRRTEGAPPVAPDAAVPPPPPPPASTKWIWIALLIGAGLALAAFLAR